MKKGWMGIAVLASALLASTAVYACWGWGNDFYMNGYGQGVSTQNMRGFQRDTLKLRESLMDKQLDLQDELATDVPDGKRVAALRREITQIQTQLQAVGDKYGMSNWGAGGNRGSRPASAGGCGCGMGCW